MKICRFNDGAPGLVLGNQVHPLQSALERAGIAGFGFGMADLVGVLADPATAAQAVQDAQSRPGTPLASATLLPPIDRPPAIWAAAANYRAHVAEMKDHAGANLSADMKPEDLLPEIFLKPSSAIVGPGGAIVLPSIARHVDFECELCAVIGRTARNVSAERALEHVFGYTICWDISVRDPWGQKQNTRIIRKGFDTFCGLGPWIVTRDEVPEPQDLRLQVEQNGRTVMQAHTGDMVHGLRELIAFLSSVATLHPGTLLTTGTPAGVAKLAPGDLLRGTIERVGAMELRVVAQGG